MTPEGGLVTSYRVNHEVISSSDGMMDLTPLIEYYEARVLGGLRLSPVDLGRGDISKASAGASSKSLRDSSREFQSVLEQKINAKHVHKDMSLMDLMVVKFALQMQCVQAVK